MKKTITNPKNLYKLNKADLEKVVGGQGNTNNVQTCPICGSEVKDNKCINPNCNMVFTIA